MSQDDIVEREGHWCNRDGCKGVMEWQRQNGESCSCHISAPCNACVNMRLTCTKCGHVLEDVSDIDDGVNIVTHYINLEEE